jgi:dual specificity protein kinase YAK1
MWSFGCILVELYLGLPLFPGNSSYDQLKKIFSIIGYYKLLIIDRVPSDELIKKSANKDRFFK